MPSVNSICLVLIGNQKKSRKEPIQLLTREMSEVKLKELNSDLSSIPWDCILNCMDVDESFNCFHKQLEETCENVIPLKIEKNKLQLNPEGSLAN